MTSPITIYLGIAVVVIGGYVLFTRMPDLKPQTPTPTPTITLTPTASPSATPTLVPTIVKRIYPTLTTAPQPTNTPIPPTSNPNAAIEELKKKYENEIKNFPTIFATISPATFQP